MAELPKQEDEFLEGTYSRGDPFFQNSRWVERAVVFYPDLRNCQSTFRDGLLEAGVAPYNRFGLEHKIGTKIGGTTFDTYVSLQFGCLQGSPWWFSPSYGERKRGSDSECRGYRKSLAFASQWHWSKALSLLLGDSYSSSFPLCWAIFT
ncbi:LOW QUALITY PROTEIN: hypothetical protein RJ641_014906 [Dillenia turbinata]|uniref:Uncharacterized protein n=1 Tax=Dillenia turbinata TaxID=194707 RepID=A0AAN8Z5D0_9MAGN